MWKRFDNGVKRTTHMYKGMFIDPFDNYNPSNQTLNFASYVVTTSAIKERLLKALDKGSRVSINFTKKHLKPPENNLPLKGYYHPLPKSDIKVMTEMQKTDRTQFNSVPFNGEVMYLRSLPTPGRFFFQKIEFFHFLIFCSTSYYKKNNAF